MYCIKPINVIYLVLIWLLFIIVIVFLLILPMNICIIVMKNSLTERFNPIVLNVGLAVHNGDWNWKHVCSPFYRFYYVTEGSAQIELPSGFYRLKPHHMYCIPAFTRHNYFCDSIFCHYYLHVYEDCQFGCGFLDKWQIPVEIVGESRNLMLMKRLCLINPSLRLPESDPATYDNKTKLNETVLKNQQSALCDRIESIGIVYQFISGFLNQACRRVTYKDERVEAIVQYINEHIFENFTIDMLADKCCLSRDYFICLFKKELSITPMQYINFKKIEKAQLILVTETTSVKNVAFSVGFDDCSYFNRLFKRVVGMSPLEYRKLHLET